ncbi:putative ribonuclease H-like domain-containing protein [Tanacetum coccineum]
MTTSDEQHSQDDEVFTQIQLLENINPNIPDDHMGDFYHLDDAKEIWLAIKARFGGNEESKKMQKSFLKQEFEEFKITEAEGGLDYLSFDDLYNKLKSLEFDVKGYAPKPSSLANAAFVSIASTNNNNDTSSNHSPSYSTSSSYSGNRETFSSHGSVVDDVIHSFLAESEPKQQLAYEDLKQIEKLDLEELDLKWQMAMLSIRVQKFEKKAGRKIKFNGQEAARFDKKLGQCYKCSQKGHFARECRAKASQDNQSVSTMHLHPETVSVESEQRKNRTLIKAARTMLADSFLAQPKGFVDPKHPKKVYKVVKALYGLHQAPRAWYATLSTFLLKNGYTRGTIHKTLFIKKDSKDSILVQVYVDDIIFGSTKKAWCDEFEDLMQSEFEMSSIGELTFFFGLQVEQRSDGIFISQDKYVADILRKFDLESMKTATTPYEPQKPKDKNGPDDDVNVYLYRSMIGLLMYLTASRPDIMFAVSTCSRFQVTPKTSNLLAVKRIFKYLKGQPKLGLWYPRDSPFELEAYTDSDYAGNHNDRKSTTGGCQFLGRRLISWQCKKQTIMATSSTEAEYVAAAHCCGQTSLRYAISHDPLIYDSLVKQFWRTASLRLAELGPPAIVATIDGAQYTIFEASVRSNLQLADEGGLSNLPDPEIYARLTHIGYQTEGHLTFWKNRFSPQWRFLVHIIIHCISSKSGGWDQFGSAIATALICLSSGRVYNFSRLIFEGMVNNLSSKKKFLMYPRFLQMILGIQTANTTQYPAHKMTKKVFANMNMRFVGAHMPLLPAMLVDAVEDQGERPTEPADQPPIPAPIPSSLRLNEPDKEPLTSTFVEDETARGSFHESPPRSHKATPSAGQPLGGAEDPLTLTALSSLISKFMQKTTSLESKLQDTKKTLGTAIITLVGRVKNIEDALKKRKRKPIISDSDDDAERVEKEIDMDSLLALENASLAEQQSSFVTPSKDTDSGKYQEQDISPSTLAAAHILSQTKLHAKRVAKSPTQVSSSSVKTYTRASKGSASKDTSSRMDFSPNAVTPGSLTHSSANQDIPASIFVTLGNMPITTGSGTIPAGVSVPTSSSTFPAGSEQVPPISTSVDKGKAQLVDEPTPTQGEENLY